MAAATYPPPNPPDCGCKYWKSKGGDFGSANAYGCFMAQTGHAHLCPNSPQGDYQRHQPEQTDLYQIVASYWPKFLERAEHEGGLPSFVKREIEAFLDCGLIEKGYVRVECAECGFERAVAYSCKKRGGICP